MISCPTLHVKPDEFLIKHSSLDNEMYERIYRHIGLMEGYEIENREMSYKKMKTPP